MITLLRHPPARFWFAASAALAGLLVTLIAVGDTRATSPPAAGTPHHGVAAEVEVRSKLPTVIRLARTPDDRLVDAAETMEKAAADVKQTTARPEPWGAVADAAGAIAELPLPPQGHPVDDELAREASAAVTDLVDAVNALPPLSTPTPSHP